MSADDHRVLEGAAALDKLEGPLDELLATAGAPVTARRPWLSCWARHHHRWRPWIVTVERSGALSGAAALARQSRHGLVRVTMLGHGQSDYAWLPVSEPAHAADLADAVVSALRRMRRPWVACLEQLPADDPVVAALAARLPCCEVTPGDPSPMASFQPGTDLRPTVSKSARSTARTTRNRLARDGVSLEVRYLGDAGQVRAVLPELIQVRAARDRAKGRLTDHADGAARGFWYEVLPMLASSGELDVALLYLDDQLAAYSIALLDPPAYRVWELRIAPALAAYSPGHLLREALLERLCADPRWSEFDMMRGTEPYKKAVARQLRETVQLRAWSSVLLRLAYRTRRTAAAIRGRLRRHHSTGRHIPR